MAKRLSKLAIAHSVRFRAVANRYPLRVTEAYTGHGGIRQAARDSDAKWRRWLRRGSVGTACQLRTGRASVAPRMASRNPLLVLIGKFSTLEYLSYLL
jgi:hypothetical protein